MSWMTRVSVLVGVCWTALTLALTGCSSNRQSSGGGGGGGGCSSCSRGNSDEGVPSGSTSPTASASLSSGPGARKICPVTGEELDSMGEAIPVTVKGTVIYVCCQGCAEKVKRDPARYIDKAAHESRGN